MMVPPRFPINAGTTTTASGTPHGVRDVVTPVEARRCRWRVMNYLRRMQTERPLLFWAGTILALWLGFQLALFLVALVIGPFGLPSWVPIVVVLGVLVLIARRQQRSR